MKNNLNSFPLSDKFIHDFGVYQADIKRYDNEKIALCRDQAFEHFLKIGLPTRNLEDWKNTDLSEVYNESYNHFYHEFEKVEDIDKVFQCNVPHLNTIMLAMLNGRYVSKDEQLKVLPNGVIYGSFEAALQQYPDLVAKHYAKYADYTKNGFTAINTAMAQDGFFIYVPDGIEVKKPVQIVNVIHHEHNICIQTRNLIVLGKNAKLTLIHCDDSYNHQKSLSNTISEIVLGENASLDHYKMQNVNNDSTLINFAYFHMDANARLCSNGLSLNGGILKNNNYVKMNGEGSECNIYGLYLMDRKQHIDNLVYVEHLKPHCTSNELFKGIIDDSASAVFNGHVIVSKDAQKTNAFQSNKNILLTDKAKVNTKPFLEIYADDVKCSHGATVGQLDTEAMFYIRSRGISEHNAQMLLMYAFADEVIQKISIEALKHRLEDMVKKRLRGELSVCEQCVLHCSNPEKEYSFEIDLTKI
ncbi:MAG: Fe-S cluster assembly protein SufD [Bacteroidetes bacterium]|nr:Fe-S cluster assembly protein SufD [Bacteroidota bacterium]